MSQSDVSVLIAAIIAAPHMPAPVAAVVAIVAGVVAIIMRIAEKP